MTTATTTIDDIWVPTRRLSLHQARSRSKLVGLLRMLFTSGAAISAGILIGSLAYTMISGASMQADYSSDEVVTMRNPRFSGRNAEGQPYVITADTAQRDGANAALIELANPALDDGINGTVRAPRGVFDQEAQQLELFEDVVMTDSAGNRFVSTHARMYVQENRVVGLQPLEGEGPLGKIRADSYEIRDGGSRIIFRGNVWTEIQSSSGDTGEE